MKKDCVEYGVLYLFHFEAWLGPSVATHSTMEYVV
jgi:hypothetical protein